MEFAYYRDKVTSSQRKVLLGVAPGYRIVSAAVVSDTIYLSICFAVERRMVCIGEGVDLCKRACVVATPTR